MQKKLKLIKYILCSFLLMQCLFIFTAFHADALTVTKLSEEIIDAQGLNFSTGTYGLWPNGIGQQVITSFNNYQYTTYYNNNRHVCIARRRLYPPSAWQVIEFTDYDFVGNDTHNSTQLGIAEDDGTIHLAFDHHVHNLHYRKSALGAATFPDLVNWEASLFSPITSQLVSGVTETQITYPTFINTPNGDLKLVMRTNGGSSSADSYAYTYSAAAHAWIDRGIFISKSGNYKGSTHRNAYISSPISYGQDGKLYTSWVWRETTDPISNHDLQFAYSEDNGTTWKNNTGMQIGITGSSAMNLNSTGLTVYTIPQNHGLANNAVSYIDSSGIYHVILSHAPLENPDYPTWSAARADSAFYHYWRTVEGVWNRSMITGLSLGNSVNLLFYDDTAYLVYVAAGDLRVAGATAANNWSDWKLLYSDGSRDYETPSIDYARWENEGILSVFIQEKPAVVGDPSIIRSVNLQVGSAHTADEDITKDMSALTWNLINRNNAAINAVTSDLFLPKTGSNGSTISWSSSDVQTITDAGAVIRPTGANKSVILRATVSKAGGINQEKEFYLNVISTANSYALTWNVQMDYEEKSAHIDADIIKVNLQAEDGVMLFAIYDNGKLLDISISENLSTGLAFGNLNFLGHESLKNLILKGFIWNRATLKPMSDYSICKFEN